MSNNQMVLIQVHHQSKIPENHKRSQIETCAKRFICSHHNNRKRALKTIQTIHSFKSILQSMDLRGQLLLNGNKMQKVLNVKESELKKDDIRNIVKITLAKW